jgi:hypothetical protein
MSKKRRRHTAEQIIKKLRDADAMPAVAMALIGLSGFLLGAYAALFAAGRPFF